MIKIKFNDATAMNDVSFARINNHVVELGGITDAPITGFTTWRMDGVTQLGDFGGYKPFTAPLTTRCSSLTMAACTSNRKCRNRETRSQLKKRKKNFNESSNSGA